MLVLSAGALLWGGSRYAHRRLARAAPPDGPLSAAAEALIERAWKGLDPARVLDTHTHLVGLGCGGTGCSVSERMRGLSHPADRLKLSIYLEAAGVVDDQHADQQYLARLSSLAAGQRPHGRYLLMAFDQAYDEHGRVLAADSEFYTPNAYVLEVVRQFPQLFVPCASVHPYRADAVEELERVAASGAVAIKWLPNAMNIDPSNERCDAFYEALARLGVTLISHGGVEKAVHAEERQKLGNPLLLRRALEHGVKVVVAHGASLGESPDLDAPGAPGTPAFDLFWRLLQDPRWRGQLYGDLSAILQVNRLSHPIDELLQHPEVHGRLINGSDYPLPAINVVMQTKPLVEHGLITAEERELLNEIDRHNPLLFDFVVKRTVARNGQHLADGIFMPGTDVFPRLQPAS